jgi:L-fuconolactonase
MRIDGHQHFWVYNTIRDKTWITDSMSVLKHDFLPAAVKPLMEENGIDGCIAVQADQTKAETHYLLDLAGTYDFIKGVVGWVDFTEDLSAFKSLKGFRHIVQAERQDDFLLREDFCQGISLLSQYNFTYDILIYPKHLPHAIKFIKKFPGQKFVIDHLAKPAIKNHLVQEWKNELEPFKQYENVYCKIAGLVTEADWEHWNTADFSNYISIVLDIFGDDRVMFGSDWPVCLTAANYSQVCDIVNENTLFLDTAEKEKLWGKNCLNFYRR